MLFTRIGVIALMIYSCFNPAMWLWTLVAWGLVEFDYMLLKAGYDKPEKKPVEVIKYKDSPEQQDKINNLESKLIVAKTSVESQLTAQSKEITKLIKINATNETIIEKQKLLIDELKEKDATSNS